MSRNSEAICRYFQMCSAVTSNGGRTGHRRSRQRYGHRRRYRTLGQHPRRGGDEVAEERMRPVGPGAKLRVELRADHPGMVAQLADLDERAVGGDAAGHQSLRFPLLLENGAVEVVE